MAAAASAVDPETNPYLAAETRRSGQRLLAEELNAVASSLGRAGGSNSSSPCASRVPAPDIAPLEKLVTISPRVAKHMEANRQAMEANRQRMQMLQESLRGDTSERSVQKHAAGAWSTDGDAAGTTATKNDAKNDAKSDAKSGLGSPAADKAFGGLMAAAALATSAQPQPSPTLAVAGTSTGTGTGTNTCNGVGTSKGAEQAAAESAALGSTSEAGVERRRRTHEEEELLQAEREVERAAAERRALQAQVREVESAIIESAIVTSRRKQEALAANSRMGAIDETTGDERVDAGEGGQSGRQEKLVEEALAKQAGGSEPTPNGGAFSESAVHSMPTPSAASPQTKTLAAEGASPVPSRVITAAAMDARLQQAGASTGVQAATAAKAPKTAAEAAEADVTERVAGVGEPAKSEAAEELLAAIKLKVEAAVRPGASPHFSACSPSLSPFASSAASAVPTSGAGKTTGNDDGTLESSAEATAPSKLSFPMPPRQQARLEQEQEHKRRDSNEDVESYDEAAQQASSNQLPRRRRSWNAVDVKHAEESSEASATPPEPPPRGSEPVGLKPALPQIGFELVLEGSAQSSSPQTDELALRAEDVEVRDKATEAEAHAKLLEVQAEAEAALRAKDSVIEELEGELLRKEFELRDAVRRRESGSTPEHITAKSIRRTYAVLPVRDLKRLS